jgi:hypothetical protein
MSGRRKTVAFGRMMLDTGFWIFDAGYSETRWE